MLRKNKFTRRFSAIIIAMFTLASSMLLEAGAAETVDTNSQNTAQTVKEVQRYQSYRSSYTDPGAAKQTVQVDLSKLIGKENATLTDQYESKKGNIVLTGETGGAEWAVEIPETGYYSIKIDYYPMKGTVSSIQRSLLIDGSLPFDEASGIEFDRVFVSDGAITQSGSGNDIRPAQIESPQWLQQYIHDKFGFFGAKLQFYLTKGTHRIKLESLAEPMAVAGITLEAQPETAGSYKDVLADWQSQGIQAAKGVLKDGVQIVQAENTYEVSDPTLYPVCDNSSAANQPYSVNKQRINSIGAARWQNPGQWISWKIEVPESGLYEIGFRCKQNYVRDINCVRSLMIDGEVPFSEAEALEFAFNSRWTVTKAGGEEPYLFYLEKGTRTITMEVSLGKLANSLMLADESLSKLSRANWDLLTLLGVNPDLYRDYNIDKYMPEVITTLKTQAKAIQAMIDEWTAMTSKQDSNIALMNQLVFQLKEMSQKPEKIPAMYQTFRDSLSTFANLLLNAKQQPLLLDYLFIAEPDARLPKADVGFFEAVKNGVLKFFISFFSDYNELSDDRGENAGKEPVKVWIGNGLSGGRDQAIVLSQLIQQDFTAKNDISVNLQLVPPATILTATVAGKGPDVALQISGSDPANYAMRGAVEDLSKLEGFDEVKTRFHESALTPYRYLGGVYALPETFSFPMMFYRKDILKELNIDIGSIKTWQNLIEVLPIIQRKNMNVSIPAAFNSYVMFLYQAGGELYKDGGKKTNLDSKASIDAFYTYMRLYTDYNLPFSYNFVTRFRTGEIPIGVEDYTTYNLLQISAPEISGEWGMVPVPGVEQKDGSILNVAPTTGAGCVLMSSAKNKEDSWAFMKWLTTSDTQYKFGKELESVMGVGARYNSANLEALQRLPWQVQDKQVFAEQMKHLRGIPEVPGGYLTQRNVGFAINSVYNTNASARDTLLSYIDQINQEITIKRSEFKLD